MIPLQSYGSIDVHGDDVPDNDIMAHALSNATVNNNSFKIKCGNAFVNEYARIDQATLERTDGGVSNPNHLLGAFPVLFPYGMGGFEVHREKDVPYEVHARWALQYADRRFRKDTHFVFQVFGVIQKRQVCRSASLQIKRSLFIHHKHLFEALSPRDLDKASAEETRCAPFANPGVRALRQHVTVVRTKVVGTDESRLSIRSQIWSTTLQKNPPSLWVTINPADTHDPIAQVFAGAKIDMDAFLSTAGPDSANRSFNVSSDPYVAAKFFHFVIDLVLEELFGIKAKNKRAKIMREKGVYGMVEAYIGTVEAQGRGTLHLHIILWLRGAPTAEKMKQALQSSVFREKVAAYI